MIEVQILTIFPGLFDSFLSFGNPARAIQAGLLSVSAIDLRDFTEDPHRSTDDYPYGGGTGMIMKPEPLARGIRSLRSSMKTPKVVLTTPQGRPFDQAVAEELSKEEALGFVCGRYEGVDERVRSFVDDEISIGDYVLSGGEIAAMVIIDAVARLIPGVLGADSHIDGESFYDHLLEYPQYTRPRVFEGLEVPSVLLEGHHLKIERWRKEQALRRTLRRRPDLIRRKKLAPDQENMLQEIQSESGNGE